MFQNSKNRHWLSAGSRTIGLGMLAAVMALPASAQERVQIEWWNAMGGRLEEIANKMVSDFNASQDKYEVVSVLKGNYEETMAAMVSAYRVGEQPAIVQAAERGFLTMLKSGAVKPVPALMAEEGYDTDWDNFVAPVAGFYLVDGKPAALPFNTSTPVFWYNADQFREAGFDAPAETWQELETQLYAMKEQGVTDCGMVLNSDFFWGLMENYAATHDQQWGTLANGFGGLGTEFVFNESELLTGHLERMSKWMDDDVLVQAGQGLSPSQLFVSGECATWVASTAAHSAVENGAEFDWSATFLPAEEGVELKNSTIGGGALWVLEGKSDEEYAAAAAFLDFVASVPTQVWWSKATGYVPVTNAAYDALTEEGYFDAHPTREVAILQLNRGEPTDNSRGFRFGNHNQAMQMLVEEVQKVWTGEKDAQEALDAAAARGNEVLRQYERLHAD
ncbi:extracellular solute-binding protein [Oceanibium sediminis]|uniref:extracellular solute-binding protein n=1 Tax=Oceanibium sediminis TaxID=2026339 RepID=UPI000DD3C631|nr:extracellular solute-binding protein [Oceanibium sediminis]